MIALFMAGGSGTRLWPLSREAHPKQMHALVGEKSLMTQTVERVRPLVPAEDVWVVTGERHLEQIASHAPGVPRAQIIAEPFALGTNLAVG
ncbi:MAG TPA: sugar phosphate nucleotidyltransferase, partial [Pyrinomonadaceae bacterium]